MRDPADGALVEEILRGLTAERKTLPSKLLYDARGSEIFQRITELPAYYLTRTEKRLLTQHAADIVAALPATVRGGRALVEFGANDESKALRLLEAAGSGFCVYLAIDIDPSVLGPIRARMRATHPQIQVETLTADFLQPLVLPDGLADLQAVGFLPGSTLGQYAPGAVVEFLRNVRRALAGPVPPAFIIGIDQCRDPARVLPAYDDPTGLSRAFNLNMLAHINRLSAGDLDARRFDHQARWNSAEDRVEISLVSRAEQSAHVAGHEIRFALGETVQTGLSYKYERKRFESMAAEAGWAVAGFWEDGERVFGIHLLQARGTLGRP